MPFPKKRWFWIAVDVLHVQIVRQPGGRYGLRHVWCDHTIDVNSLRSCLSGGLYTDVCHVHIGLKPGGCSGLRHVWCGDNIIVNCIVSLRHKIRSCWSTLKLDIRTMYLSKGYPFLRNKTNLLVVGNTYRHVLSRRRTVYNYHVVLQINIHDCVTERTTKYSISCNTAWNHNVWGKSVLDRVDEIWYHHRWTVILLKHHKLADHSLSWNAICHIIMWTVKLMTTTFSHKFVT